MHSWCPDCFKNWMLLPSVPFSSLSVTQAPKHTCSTQISPHPWEPSLSNGDILTYFELGNHWSYKQSFWHLNSSWDNDLSPRSWYLARPVSSCLLQLQCLWISQFFKPLAGEFEELQEGYACCLATKKLSSQNASPLLPPCWKSVCTRGGSEGQSEKSQRASGMKGFHTHSLGHLNAAASVAAPWWHSCLSQQPVCSAPVQWEQFVECSWLYALFYNRQVNGCLVKCKIKCNLYQEVKNISSTVERLIQIPALLVQ